MRPGLRVAVILDPFSELAFRYEWASIPVRPSSWRTELERCPPDLLFVESAWRGNNGAWNYVMTAPESPHASLRALVAWCRQAGVPTAFWNKEDPPNYDRFLSTARLFDHVFTVAAERVPDYRRDLGHDRVHVLPFAAQPRIHNPVRDRADRPYDVAFAGSYFAEKHPLRRQQVETVLGPAREHGLHIFSRQLGNDDRYQFPAEYADYVVGSLSYGQALAAYKLYKVFLNVNSVEDSSTMCARRLFELAAAGTPVVSGWSDAVRPVFGDLVPLVRTEDETRQALRALLSSPELRDRMGHRAHRAVMRQHTYAQRVDRVLDQIGIATSVRPQRHVSMVVPTNRPDRIDDIVATFVRQSYQDLELVVVLHGIEGCEGQLRAACEDAGIRDLVVRLVDGRQPLGACMIEGVSAASGNYVAKVDDDNHYGQEYVSDLVGAFDYTRASVVGKWAHYVHLESSGATLLRFAEWEHRYCEKVQGGTILASREVLAAVPFPPLPRSVDSVWLAGVRAAGADVYSADRFCFASMRRADPGSHTWNVSDAEMLSRASSVAFFGDPREHVDA